VRQLWRVRRAGFPPALGWLLIAVVATGVIWALVVPPWQVPDEDAHFAYAQTVAELQRLPADDGRPDEIAGKSTEQRLAERDSGFRGSYQRPEAKPAWTMAAERRWRDAEARLGAAARRDGGGANAAANNPPGYYLLAAVPYAAASRGDVIDRLHLMRAWSVLALAAFTLSAWLLAGELVGRDRVLQLVAGALAGLLPMATFVSTGVTPDALLLPLWGFATWLGVRGLRRGFSPAAAALLVALAGAAVAVKLAALALLPAVGWALIVALWRAQRWAVPRVPVLGAAVAAVLAVAATVAVAASPGRPRLLGSYLWQFYLPELPGQFRFARLSEWPLRDAWLEGVVGAFGWLEVRFPGWTYALAAAVAVIVVVGAARAVRGSRAHAVTLFLALLVLALPIGLHLAEYRMLVLDDRAFVQGRYLLPLAPLGAAAAAAALGALSPQARAVGTGLALGGVAAWQLASLAIVVGRFYA
jgi:4-amino-4-deoxy-L-arabinose transferase-like glycosyltransferase